LEALANSGLVMTAHKCSGLIDQQEEEKKGRERKVRDKT
jgi:hypothetical protein